MVEFSLKARLFSFHALIDNHPPLNLLLRHKFTIIKMPNNNPLPTAPPFQDWYCQKCLYHNPSLNQVDNGFKCFNCGSVFRGVIVGWKPRFRLAVKKIVDFFRRKK